MNLLNQTLLIGRIVDEDIKTQLVSETSDVVISYFKIAINKGFFDKQKKEWVDKTKKPSELKQHILQIILKKVT